MVRMRINRSATRKRRSHHGLTEPRLSECKECGAKHLRHRACNECGKYRGRMVEDVQSKNIKKAAKKIKHIEALQPDLNEAPKQDKNKEQKAEPIVKRPTDVAAKTTTKKVTTKNK